MTTLAPPPQEEEETPQDARHRWLPWSLPANYLVLHFGFFNLAPILPILVKARLTGGDADVGAVLFAYNSAIGYSCLVIARWLSRVNPRLGMVIGLFAASGSMVALAYAHSLAMMIIVLAVAGSGLSTHFLLARTVLAQAIPKDSGRNHAYSLIALAVNIGGAVGPITATTVYAASGAKTVLFIVAACYALAALLLVIMVPGDLHPLSSTLRWPVSRASWRAVLHDTNSVRAIIVSAAGGFIYSQFFSSIALLITSFIAKGPEQGTLFAINAVTVIIVQMPMTAAIGRRLDKGMPAFNAMRLGLVTFAIAMLLLGVLVRTSLPLFLTFAMMIVVFSVAETIYAPVRDTAFARMPAVSQIEAFNIRFIFITVGESFGALFGGAVFLELAGHGTGSAYWLVLGGGGVLIAIIGTLVRVGRGSDPAAPDPAAPDPAPAAAGD